MDHTFFQCSLHSGKQLFAKRLRGIYQLVLWLRLWNTCVIKGNVFVFVGKELQLKCFFYRFTDKKNCIVQITRPFQREQKCFKNDPLLINRTKRVIYDKITNSSKTFVEGICFKNQFNSAQFYGECIFPKKSFLRNPQSSDTRLIFHQRKLKWIVWS